MVGFIGSVLGYFFRKLTAKRKLNSAEKLAKKVIDDAQREADNKRR